MPVNPQALSNIHWLDFIIKCTVSMCLFIDASEKSCFTCCKPQRIKCEYSKIDIIANWIKRVLFGFPIDIAVICIIKSKKIFDFRYASSYAGICARFTNSKAQIIAVDGIQKRLFWFVWTKNWFEDTFSRHLLGSMNEWISGYRDKF